MSYYESQEPVSMLAGGTIGQYKVVQIDTASDRGILLCTDVDNTGIIGMVQESSVSGDCVSVAIGGVTKAVCGGTVTRGVQVASSTTGFVINAASGSTVVGIALSAGVANDIIPVLISVGEKL